MSMIKCKMCDIIYDTDYQMETDPDGDCICDRALAIKDKIGEKI